MDDRRKKHRHLRDTPTSSSSSTSDSDSDSDHSSRRRRRRDGRDSRRREREEKRKKRRDRERKSKKKKKRLYDSDGDGSEEERFRVEPQTVVREMMTEFPNAGNDLKLLLQMIDDGQAVDIKGISERSLMKHLKKLFLSLNLKEKGDRVFLLPSKALPTLDIVGPLIPSCMDLVKEQADPSAAVPETCSVPKDVGSEQIVDDHMTRNLEDNSVGPRRRVIGPAMPSAELLAAASKLTEAQTELREAELDDDTELFIGPPPPAMVSEAESANEAERFEEVTRIMEVEADSPYDFLGVNHNMSNDNIKKRKQVAMAFTKSTVILAIICFILIHELDINGGSQHNMVAAQHIDCGSKCGYRCSKASRQKICLRACNSCCQKCNCVPPGTAGNRDVCPCYAALTTHDGKLKCP